MGPILMSILRNSYEARMEEEMETFYAYCALSSTGDEEDYEAWMLAKCQKEAKEIEKEVIKTEEAKKPIRL